VARSGACVARWDALTSGSKKRAWVRHRYPYCTVLGFSRAPYAPSRTLRLARRFRPATGLGGYEVPTAGLSPKRTNKYWVPHCPDFLRRLVALIHSMRLSLMKGAHADLSSTAWQEIGVKPSVGLSGRNHSSCIRPSTEPGFLTGKPPRTISSSNGRRLWNPRSRFPAPPALCGCCRCERNSAPGGPAPAPPAGHRFVGR